MKTEISCLLWVPLIGFDVRQSDRGAAEYLRRCPFKPEAIALFLFNADVVNLHSGGDENEKLPEDYCNYYGSPRNEIRERQVWTKKDLKILCRSLKSVGVQTYLSIMGAHFLKEDGQETGFGGYQPKQLFLEQHPEIIMRGIKFSGNAYVLKRFADGRYFQDHFAEKARETLLYYGMDGIHLSDGIFPPCIQVQNGDFSLDMIEQFMSWTHCVLPPLLLTKRDDRPIMTERAAYIWKNLRREWINFISGRWEQFFVKLCGEVHSVGKKVMVNNAWTSEPFEALYRFGIDYKSLERAGVDTVCIEDQAVSIYANDPTISEIKMHEYLNTPMIMKAYAPNIRYAGINFAKDSTEEASIIAHLPTAFEREAFSVLNKLYSDGKKTNRAVDSLFVCLADALTAEEWKKLGQIYEKAFMPEPVKSVSPVLVWSDAAETKMLNDYIETRRFTLHRMVCELAKRGGMLGGAVRIENLLETEGDVFVPNADLLNDDELKILAEYKKGAVMCTFLKSRKFQLPDEATLYFEDEEIGEEQRLCFAVFGKSLRVAFTEKLGDAGYGKDIAGNAANFEDTYVWMEDIVFTKVSGGFLTKAAEVLHACVQNTVRYPFGEKITVHTNKDGSLRIYAENDDMLKYKQIPVEIVGEIVRVENIMDFPVQPLKLISNAGYIVANPGVKSYQDYKGVVLKLSPGGCAMIKVIKR